MTRKPLYCHACSLFAAIVTASTIIKAMKVTHTNKRNQAQADKARNHELLFKGIVIGLMGLGVLLAPGFMAPGEMREMIAQSHWVGWFALLLGGVFTTQSLARLFRSRS